MSVQSGSSSKSSRFLSVFMRPQSYANIVYLLLALPLGIAYFTVLAAGLTLGLGLVVVWVGIPALVLVFAVSYALVRLERGLTAGLLRYGIPLQPRKAVRDAAADGPHLSAGELRIVAAWRRTKRHLSNPLTWSGMLYLMAKLPLGIVSFLLAVALLLVTLALIAAPVLYLAWPEGVPSVSVGLASAEKLLHMNAGDLSWAKDVLAFNGFGAESLWQSLVFSVAGLPMVLVTLHVLNGAAFLWARWSRLMLGSNRADAASKESKSEPFAAQEAVQEVASPLAQGPDQAAGETGNQEQAAA